MLIQPSLTTLPGEILGVSHQNHHPAVANVNTEPVLLARAEHTPQTFSALSLRTLMSLVGQFFYNNLIKYCQECCKNRTCTYLAEYSHKAKANFFFFLNIVVIEDESMSNTQLINRQKTSDHPPTHQNNLYLKQYIVMSDSW